MIARIWRGRTPEAKAEAHFAHFKETGLKGFNETPGNRGVWFLPRVDQGIAETLVISLWESRDAIRAFAGPDIERAHYYPGDDEFRLEKEPTVAHYEVMIGG